MRCTYFESGLCRSCALIEQPYTAQLAAKQRDAGDRLSAYGGIDWLPPVPSAPSGFRTKAKMIVGGTGSQPTLGILDRGGRGVDLRDCLIVSDGIRTAFDALTSFISAARLEPYDVPRREGELKNLIVTESPDGELMLRFVLRSEEPVERIRARLPWLLAELPRLAVVSVNLLPEHKAVVEGEKEIVLTERSTLPMRLGDVVLNLRPQGFFQTNTEIARALYREAAEWVDEISPASLWDLYCGVGGFALHCADPSRSVVGIEASAEAVAAAEQGSREAALPRVRFQTGDATAFALSAVEVPDLVIVNPPRRGIGPELAEWLETSAVPHVLYSSCNAASLARDLERMPALRPRRGRVFDMFPHTAHYEVLVLLERAS